MPVPPSPLLDETISAGQARHIADHEQIAAALNNDTASLTADQTLSGDINFTGAVNFTGEVAGVGDEGVQIQTYNPNLGDGTTDIVPAINALYADGARLIELPYRAAGYAMNTHLDGPDGLTLRGAGRGMCSGASTTAAVANATKLLQRANVDLITMNDGFGLESLALVGDGATYTTKRALVIPTGKGQQHATKVTIANFGGYCIDFEDTLSGSLSKWTEVLAYRYLAASGSGRYAVHIEDAVEASAVPRSFVDFDSAGTPSFDFGGANDLFIVGAFLNDLKYSVETRAVLITSSRLGSPQPNLDLKGFHNNIVGCNVYQRITLDAATAQCAVGPNSYNNTGSNTQAPVIDNSANAGDYSNLVTHGTYPYTPVATADGGGFSLGNGTLVGEYSRAGSTLTGHIRLTVGATTNMGTGILRFTIPKARSSGGGFLPVGGALVQDALPPATYNATVIIPGGNVAQVIMLRDAGYVTSVSPIAFAAGDIIDVGFSYAL